MARKTTTEEKEKAFTLGDAGVNLVSTPLHHTAGELQRAQNVIFSLDQAQHGLTKRPGMTKFNASAMSGAVLAFQTVPLPAPDSASDLAAVTPDGTSLFVFPDDTGSGAGIHVSTNGSTWAHSATTTDFDEGTAYQRAILLHKTGGICLGPKVKGVNDPVAFQTFDGTTWADAFTCAVRTLNGTTYNPRDLYAWDQDGTNFYLLVWFVRTGGAAGTDHYQVVQVNQTTYAETYIGSPFAIGSGINNIPANSAIYISFATGAPAGGTLAVYGGNIYLQCSMISGTYYEGRVYRNAPNAAYDEAWSLDYSTGTPGSTKAYVPIGMVGHGTQLWASFNHQSAYNTAPTFLKREAELWSVVETGVAAGEDYFQPIYALGDVVYAWKTPDPGGTLMQLWYSDDAWATSAAIVGAVARTNHVYWTRGLRYSQNGKVYCVTAISPHGTYFEIWEMDGATATCVEYNNPGGGDLGGCGAAFLGAAVAPTPGTTTYELPDPDAADPVLPDAPTPIAVKTSVYLGADFPVPAYFNMPVVWTAAAYNVGSAWSTGAPTRLTVPYGGDGYYLLTAQVAWGNNAAGREMRAYLYVGSEIVARALSCPASAGGNVSANYEHIHVAALVKLVAGQTISLNVYHVNYSGTFTMVGGASQTWLQAVKLV